MSISTRKTRVYKAANHFSNLMLSIAITGFSIILLYIIFHASTIFKNSSPTFSDSHLYYVYGALAIIGMIGCMAALKLPTAYKVNLVLTGCSGLVGLYLVESVLFMTDREHGILEDGQIHQKYAREAGLPFDARTRIDIIRDAQRQGVSIYPDVSPYLFIDTDGLHMNDMSLFPLSSLSRRSLVLCNETGKYSIFESDEHGFNNPAGIFATPHPDMMLIGDSFTHGACVQPSEDISSILRKSTTGSVVNLGKSGIGPLLELAILREYAEPKQPKTLLWMYYEENDQRELLREEGSSFLLRYLEKNFSQDLIHKQDEIDALLERYIGDRTRELENQQQQQRVIALKKIATCWHLRNRLGMSRKLSYPKPSSLFTTILEHARDTTSTWGGQVYFVYLPTWERYAKPVEHDDFMHRHEILAQVQSLNIPIIDIHDAFQRHPDPLSLFPFRIHGHYTKEGYKLVAQTIASYLKISSDAHNRKTDFTLTPSKY